MYIHYSAKRHLWVSKTLWLPPVHHEDVTLYTSDLYLRLGFVSTLMEEPLLKINQPDMGLNTLGKQLGCHQPLNSKLLHKGAHPMECVYLRGSSVCQLRLDVLDSGTYCKNVQRKHVSSAVRRGCVHPDGVRMTSQKVKPECPAFNFTCCPVKWDWVIKKTHYIVKLTDEFAHKSNI